MSTFSDRLQELILEYKIKHPGYTQAQIAKDLEISPQVLSSYVKGREPNFEMLKEMACYFDVSVDYLLSFSPFRNPYDEKYITDLNLSQEESKLITCIRAIDIKTIKPYFGSYNNLAIVLETLLSNENGLYALSILKQFLNSHKIDSIKAKFSSAMLSEDIHFGKGLYLTNYKSERAREKVNDLFLDEIKYALWQMQDDLDNKWFARYIDTSARDIEIESSLEFPEDPTWNNHDDYYDALMSDDTKE